MYLGVPYTFNDISITYRKKTVCDVPTGSHFLLSMARLLLLLLLFFNFVKAMMEVHFFVFL
jgi:hypothetical protein